MSRRQRIDFPGAVHHVMNRGANRQTVFDNDLDRLLLINIWEEASERFGIEIICFCWMDNHFHTMVRCPDAQLSDTMQFVSRSYTQQYNHHHQRDGALYRGRFHSVLIDDESHADNASRYIHLNPVAAGICELQSLDLYRWGTYRHYVTEVSTPSWIRVDQGLKNFSHPDSYRAFVENTRDDPLVERFYTQPFSQGRVLGTSRFLERLAEEHGPQITKGLTAGLSLVTLDLIDAAVCAACDVPLEQLRSGVRENAPRQVAVLLARDLYAATAAEIAERYNFPSNATATSALYRYRNSELAGVRALYESARESLRDI